MEFHVYHSFVTYLEEFCDLLYQNPYYKINENTQYMSTFCVTTFYEVYGIVDGMACGMVSTESKLGLLYYVLRWSKVVNSFI